MDPDRTALVVLEEGDRMAEACRMLGMDEMELDLTALPCRMLGMLEMELLRSGFAG